MSTKLRILLALGLAASCLSSSAQAAPRSSTGPRCPDVIRPGPPPRASGISKDYSSVAYFGKIAILGSKNVDRRALCTACRLLEAMTADQPQLAQTMEEMEGRVLLFSKGTKITDLPEHQRRRNKFTHDGRLMDEVGGLGPGVLDADLTSRDTDLIPPGNSGWMPGDTLIHEFAHVVHLSLAWKLDRSFVHKVNEAYSEAMRKGLWRENYAATNSSEYFAVGATIYFQNSGTRALPSDKLPFDRISLKAYDRKLYDIIDLIYRSSWQRQFLPAEYDPCRGPFPKPTSAPIQAPSASSPSALPPPRDEKK